ncbi:MAG: undecaprenyldiphospho-muramoylpentapeptide beta-N-acetylglucosaminyltransferase [Actinomycetota bacterium]|nr:undecaprenyldiphospho-muramoylpentapeptide beta-N-acetylglucosaminyltransferase [Actinomycetota bacterium]
MTSVVLAGGGTAGHIEPALALADALRRSDPTTRIVALGTARGLETRLVPARGYELALIPPVPVPRRLTPELLALPGRLRSAVVETGAVLDRVGADVVVGFGGYVAAPAYLAAWRSRVPLVVHEANAHPGLANRLGARLTREVAVSTPDTRLPHAQYVGLPLRRSIATLERHQVRDEARAAFGLDPALPTLLVFGGSQGARRLNEAAAGAAPGLSTAGIQVLHATGPAHSVDVIRPPGGAPYVTVPYLDRMDLAYAAADLALCRAGAMTCAEVAAVGLPVMFVPLPHGNGEQELNARPLVRAAGGLLVRDADLSSAVLEQRVRPLLLDPARLAAMSRAASGLGRRDADERLVAMVVAAAKEGADGGVRTARRGRPRR